MEIKKEAVIKDLKVLRLLAQILPLTGNGPAFYWDRINHFFDENNDSLCDFALVAHTLGDVYDGDYGCEGSVFNEFCGACVFVEPKEKEELEELRREFSLHRMCFPPEAAPARYKRAVLPTLLKMIDLALKDVDKKG